MRYIQLKLIQVCSSLKLLQQLEEINTGIKTGVPLMHNSAYSDFKEFLGPLPKPMYYNLLHIFAQFESVAFESFV